jgi:hypothetical protein
LYNIFDILRFSIATRHNKQACSALAAQRIVKCLYLNSLDNLTKGNRQVQ